MLTLMCAQVPSLRLEQKLTLSYMCKAFIIYTNSAGLVYAPLRPHANIRKAKKTGYEVVDVSLEKVNATALGFVLLLAHRTFPEEIVEFCNIPGNIQVGDEEKLIEQWEDDIKENM